jgi:hypothetical protein
MFRQEGFGSFRGTNVTTQAELTKPIREPGGVWALTGGAKAVPRERVSVIAR